MVDLSLIQKISIWALPVIFAITVHEVAHGWVALKFGDRTSQMIGRLTLNPIKHIDPIGTILVPGLLLAIGGFVFGWAKPIPVNPKNFKNPRHDMAWVAIAGPVSNIIMAIIWAVIAKLGYMIMPSYEGVGQFMVYSGMAGITINLVLAVLNMIPIPPLDGSRIAAAFLPKTLHYYYMRIEPYGFFIILGLMVAGILGMLITAPFRVLQSLILQLVGL
jgi:Zn-dependent protease